MKISRELQKPRVMSAAILLGLGSLFAYASGPAHDGPKTMLTTLNTSNTGSAATHLSSLPGEAQASISGALGRDLDGYQVRAVGRGFAARNARQGFSAKFSATGVELRNPSERWGLVLRSYGYGKAMRTVPAARLAANLNRLEYRRGSLTEWYMNGPAGLEQGFTFSRRPSGARGQMLTVVLATSGNLRAAVEADGRSLALRDASGHTALHYAGLTARDARGRQLPGRMKIRDATLLLEVDDSKARYPLVLDPMVAVGKLEQTDGVNGDFFGNAVAISGNLVAVGAPNATIGSTSMQGAVYIFVRPSFGWKNLVQVAKLTASDGAANDLLGFAVAASGNTVIASAANNNNIGAAYVFVRPPSGWVDATETGKLTPSNGQSADTFGFAVGISGNAAIVGAPNASSLAGAAYVFVRPAGGWTSATQTAELTASDGSTFSSVGISVAISGSTAVAGAYGANHGSGAVYVYTQPAGGWLDATETAKLAPSDAVVNDLFGQSVAVSGNTLVVGAPAANIRRKSAQGAAYVFVEPAAGWVTATQNAKLTASDGMANDLLGYSVSVSGNNVVAGAPSAAINGNANQGAVYLFVKPAAGWADRVQNVKYVAFDGLAADELGLSVSISVNTLVGGAPQSNSTTPGAAYVFGKR